MWHVFCTCTSEIDDISIEMIDSITIYYLTYN